MAVDYDSKDYLKSVDAYWRAANYLSVGQLFLMKNPLLKTPLVAEDVKPKPIGHWGTIAPQNFIYAHLNRVLKKYDLNMFYIEGSGHGGQVMVSNSYLDGSYTERYPEITQDEKGMAKLFKRFSFPGGVASHAAPETPGSIHEGGELGYSLSHGTGVFWIIQMLLPLLKLVMVKLKLVPQLLHGLVTSSLTQLKMVQFCQSCKSTALRFLTQPLFLA